MVGPTRQPVMATTGGPLRTYPYEHQVARSDTRPSTRLDAWRPHVTSSRQGGYGPTDPVKRRVSMSLFGLLRLAFRLGYIQSILRLADSDEF